MRIDIFPDKIEAEPISDFRQDGYGFYCLKLVFAEGETETTFSVYVKDLSALAALGVKPPELPFVYEDDAAIEGRALVGV